MLPMIHGQERDAQRYSLTLPGLKARGFLLGLWPRYANNGVTCLTRPEPGKIEVASPQAYLVYNLGFDVPETKP
ncbi:hypothetical protein [Moorena sp. SIO3I6]|uniref:hypothetical protein n=1 Tax=Moorena sp. SIO3I6 TaxID=2607831 RepID=UPI0025E1A2C0|nr:hypothetical protein [Moorena sp. SIO3I6]